MSSTRTKMSSSGLISTKLQLITQNYRAQSEPVTHQARSKAIKIVSKAAVVHPHINSVLATPTLGNTYTLNSILHTKLSNTLPEPIFLTDEDIEAQEKAKSTKAEPIISNNDTNNSLLPFASLQFSDDLNDDSEIDDLDLSKFLPPKPSLSNTSLFKMKQGTSLHTEPNKAVVPDGGIFGMDL